MAQTDTAMNDIEKREGPTSNGGYTHKQTGCMWVLLLTVGILQFTFSFLAILFTRYTSQQFNSYLQQMIYGIILICWGISTIYVNIEDRGDHLLLTYGPFRWCLCGMGKEKVPYKNIKDFQITRTCFYGLGIGTGGICGGSSIKLFNTCSCCCDGAKCCGHKTVRLTINERPQGLNASGS